jgi:hypothetical protein
MSLCHTLPEATDLIKILRALEGKTLDIFGYLEAP